MTRLSIFPRLRVGFPTCATSNLALRVAGLSLLVFSQVVQAHAAILFLKGSDEALHVRTIRESETTIVVGVRGADGTFTERIFERRNIDQFIPTVSKTRLAELDLAKPTLYRDFAEELAEKKIDPDARDEAIRLYLIAAHLDPDRLGRSALLGMVSLARNPNEERKFRAMAYLLDPKHDRRVLKQSTGASSDASAAEGRDDLLAALRTLRQGNRRIAQRMAQRPSVIAAFRHYSGGFSHEDFLAACESADSLDNATLARIIRYELTITGVKPDSDDAATVEDSPRWSAALNADDNSVIPDLSLKNLTEFDPEKSVYRNGKWVQPSE